MLIIFLIILCFSFKCHFQKVQNHSGIVKTEEDMAVQIWKRRTNLLDPNFFGQKGSAGRAFRKLTYTCTQTEKEKDRLNFASSRFYYFSNLHTVTHQIPNRPIFEW
jgi:hypothetical protein